MNKKFRCGRLILTRNGAIKKVDLEDGGGSRYCHWDYINMNFHTVHYRLLNIFNLSKIIKINENSLISHFRFL
jgi:hypothetical protein